MIRKQDIMCVEKISFGPFWEEFLVFVEIQDVLGGMYSLRVMDKKKIIEYGEEDMVDHEYVIRSMIRHPFLINTVCGFQDYKHLFLIEEQSKNHLMELIRAEGRISKKACRFYIVEILLVIQYLHTKGLCYGFLSPSNIMIGDDGHIKLKYSFLNEIDNVVGGIDSNIEYASADYLNDWGLSCVSDYWSVGIVMYKMLAGITPFASQDMASTAAKMREGKVRFPVFFDACTKDLISKLLVIEPRKRLGYIDRDAADIRRHPFFDGIDWDKAYMKATEPPFLFNAIKSKEQLKPANLGILYTTDYLSDQKDGYGRTFRQYGSAHVPEVYKGLWRNGYI